MQTPFPESIGDYNMWCAYFSVLDDGQPWMWKTAEMSAGPAPTETRRIMVAIRVVDNVLNDTYTISARVTDGEEWTKTATFTISSEVVRTSNVPNNVKEYDVYKKAVYMCSAMLPHTMVNDNQGFSFDEIKSTILFGLRNNKFINVITSHDANYAQEESLRSLSKELPGVFIQVVPPCEGQTDTEGSVCLNKQLSIMRTVIHLNDEHKWTRERIADWLDTLYAEGIDISFKDPVC